MTNYYRGYTAKTDALKDVLFTTGANGNSEAITLDGSTANVKTADFKLVPKDAATNIMGGTWET